MAGSLQDKVVAVTGGGRGIGRAIALHCASEGAAVVVNDFGGSLAGEGHDAGPAAEVVAEIEAAGGRACANLANVADADSAATIISDAVDNFGRIDAVVNNAGVSRDGMFHKMTQENWQAVVDVHLHGSFNVSRAAAPHFREQGSGAFVHTTSTSGLIGNVGQSNYSAAKMGILGLSNSIALDMRRYRVRSNCVAPLRVEPHDRQHPDGHAGGKGAGGTSQDHDRGEGRTHGGVLVLRPEQRRIRPDFLRAKERDLSLQDAATGPIHASGRGLDGRVHRVRPAARIQSPTYHPCRYPPMCSPGIQSRLTARTAALTVTPNLRIDMRAV